MASSSGSPPAGSFLDAVRAAGVVGEGGAGFPAHVKYDTRVGVVIANGCECEPLLATDQQVMIREPQAVMTALAALKRHVGAARAVLGIKAKHQGAIDALTGPAGAAGVEIFTLGNFYPAGDEQILVREVTGDSVPPLGLPKDVDAVVANVGTLASVSRALAGKPVTRKLLTVTGEAARPCVIEAPIGASLGACLDFAGGHTAADPVFLVGGPMMGRFLETRQALNEAVVTKTTGGLIVLERGCPLHEAAGLSPETMRRRAAAACIQCRYCTDLCPRYLIGHGFETHRVMKAFALGREDSPAGRQAMLCCECGVCETVSCPMRLSPRRINAWIKGRMRASGTRYEGPLELRPAQAELRGYRRLPTDRLMLRVGISQYAGLHPEFAGTFEPGVVRIPFSQHIGAPARPVVAVGDRVAAGDVIGEIPDGALGARVHASLSGVVEHVGRWAEIKGA